MKFGKFLVSCLLFSGFMSGYTNGSEDDENRLLVNLDYINGSFSQLNHILNELSKENNQKSIVKLRESFNKVEEHLKDVAFEFTFINGGNMYNVIREDITKNLEFLEVTIEKYEGLLDTAKDIISYSENTILKKRLQAAEDLIRIYKEYSKKWGN